MKQTLSFFWIIILLLSACAATPASIEEPKLLTWQEQYDLGIRYLSEGNYEEAIIAFTAAIEIDPKQALAYVGRGQAYVLSGETEENLSAAQADYEQALELDETLTDAWLGLANIYVLLDDDESAIEILQQAINLGFDTSDIQSRLDTLRRNRTTNTIQGATDAYITVVENCVYKSYSSLNGQDQQVSRGLLYDLNHDGQDELLLRYVLGSRHTFEVWTIKNGEAICAFDNSITLGWYNPRDDQTLYLIEDSSVNELVYTDSYWGTDANGDGWYFYSVEDIPYQLSHELSYSYFWDEDSESSTEGYKLDGKDIKKREFDQMLAKVRSELEVLQIGSPMEGLELLDLLQFLRKNSSSESLHFGQYRSQKLDLIDYLGTDIYEFSAWIGDMSDSDASDGSTELSNGKIIVSAAPWDLGPTAISFISMITDCDYCIAGVEYGMPQTDAQELLLQEGWTCVYNSLPRLDFKRKDGVTIALFVSDGDFIDGISLFAAST